MSAGQRVRLTVNVDAVILMRELQLWPQPDAEAFARAAVRAGVDGLLFSLHSRHVSARDRDPDMLGSLAGARLCLAACLRAEMLERIAGSGASHCVIVPGERHEHSSGGALAAAVVRDSLTMAGKLFAGSGIELAARIDPDPAAVEVCIAAGLPAVEFNTAAYALASRADSRAKRLEQLRAGVACAHAGGLQVSVRGGLNFDNVSALLDMPEIGEFRIGQALIAAALFDGIDASVARMRQLLGG